MAVKTHNWDPTLDVNDSIVNKDFETKLCLCSVSFFNGIISSTSSLGLGPGIGERYFATDLGNYSFIGNGWDRSSCRQICFYSSSVRCHIGICDFMIEKSVSHKTSLLSSLSPVWFSHSWPIINRQDHVQFQNGILPLGKLSSYDAYLLGYFIPTDELKWSQTLFFRVLRIRGQNSRGIKVYKKIFKNIH